MGGGNKKGCGASLVIKGEQTVKVDWVSLYQFYYYTDQNSSLLIGC